MADSPHVPQTPVVRIEPDDRLVVLARTLDVRDPAAAAALEEEARRPARPAECALGRALYRHRAVFRGVSDAPAWSHLDLHYFRDLIPADALRALTREPVAGVRLLRAEILLTTPGAFMMPQGWQGVAGQAGRVASLEYIDVAPAQLGAYRDLMRRFIGPAAATLVAQSEIGTFRTLETAAVLHHDPVFCAQWNQIHLCEVPAEGFAGFGAALDAAVRAVAPDGGFAALFAGLDAMRTIPRWTFNDAVVEADGALLALGEG